MGGFSQKRRGGVALDPARWAQPLRVQLHPSSLLLENPRVEAPSPSPGSPSVTHNLKRAGGADPSAALSPSVSHFTVPPPPPTLGPLRRSSHRRLSQFLLLLKKRNDIKIPRLAEVTGSILQPWNAPPVTSR